ncbi:MAG: hypothetical protein GY915_04260 [bacterium]|nr:hypothetical protein [bacterium]
MLNSLSKVVISFFVACLISPLYGHPAPQKGLTPFQDPATKLYGFKDGENHIVVPPQFENVLGNERTAFTADHLETEYLVPVMKFRSWWQMDRQGNLKFEAVFFDNGPDYYESGLARFLEKGKVGFHDRQGNVAVKPQFDFAAPFSGYQNGKEIEKKFTLVCNGCWAEPMKDIKYVPLTSGGGMRTICGCNHNTVTGGKWGAIDQSGNIVVPLEDGSWENANKRLKEYEENL